MGTNASQALPAWLIVLEAGAVWPAWVDDHRADEESAIIVQQLHESSLELVGRIRHYAQRFLAENRTLEAAVLAVSRSVPIGRRVAVAQELFRMVCPVGGTLAMSCPGAALDERHELLALAGALTEQFADPSTRVVVHFDESPPLRSGTRLRPPEAESAKASEPPPPADSAAG
jgi:hypothetical protein